MGTYRLAEKANDKFNELSGSESMPREYSSSSSGQMGEAEPNDFLVAIREEMEALWDSEEVEVMQAEFRML